MEVSYFEANRVIVVSKMSRTFVRSHPVPLLSFGFELAIPNHSRNSPLKFLAQLFVVFLTQFFGAAPVSLLKNCQIPGVTIAQIIKRNSSMVCRYITYKMPGAIALEVAMTWLFRRLWASIAAIFAAAVAAIGILSACIKMTEIAANRSVICGSIPLGACARTYVSDHIRAAVTRSCDARLLPAIKAHHQTIAQQVHSLRGRDASSSARYIGEHRVRLNACKADKSVAGLSALQGATCIRLRESGHLLVQLSVNQMISDTEVELECEYDK
jgi:hypothetical protein